MEDASLELEPALREQEERVDSLLKAANKYVGTLKTWKKACQVGHISNLQKSAAQAGELVNALPEATSETQEAWDFDINAYLAGDDWWLELQAAAEKLNLKTLEENRELISSPVMVQAVYRTNSLKIGKTGWATIRPQLIANELKRLRDATAAANSQQFLESLHEACVHLSGERDPHATFSAIYELFCFAPGYKKENPSAAFGQQIYALHRSESRTTRKGKRLTIELATGNVKEKDVFSVISEDGRPIRYYSLFFK